MITEKRKVEDLMYDFISDSYATTNHLKQVWWKKRIPVLVVTLVGSLVLKTIIVG